jgi:serine/threonine-protein kinase/endoribonuclease IRE1
MLKIVHCDIKPQNVLLSKKSACMIADLGLCKALRDNQSSFTTENVGTSGWMAPEVLLEPGTTTFTRSVDIFSAGCVLHYLVGGGSHPFGRQWFEREQNVRLGLTHIDTGDLHADDLTRRMVAAAAAARPAASAVLLHPYFWSATKRLQFLMDVSDRIEKQDPGTPLLQRLEQSAATVLGGVDWTKRLDTLLQSDLKRFRSYRVDSVVDLLRAIRNKKHHYRELPANLKKRLGAIPAGYLGYFLGRFPTLLLHVYQSLIDSGCHAEPGFREYYAAP